jgi:hypothetical protein
VTCRFKPSVGLGRPGIYRRDDALSKRVAAEAAMKILEQHFPDDLFNIEVYLD